MTNPRKGYAEHGTITRYNQHMNDGERGDEIDEACRKAKRDDYAAYMRTPGVRSRVKNRRNLRTRALTRLGQRYRKELREIMREIEIEDMMRDIHEKGR